MGIFSRNSTGPGESAVQSGPVPNGSEELVTNLGSGTADRSKEKPLLFSEDGFLVRCGLYTAIALAAIFGGIGYGHTQDAFGPPKRPSELPKADLALDGQSVSVQPQGDGHTIALDSLD